VWSSRFAPVGLVVAAVVGALTVARPVHAGQARAQPAPSGERLYQRDCAYCHGPQGEGTPRGQSIQHIGLAEADYSLTTGRMPKRTPGEERKRRPSRYSHAEVAALLDFMTPFIGGGPGIPDVDPGSGDLAHGGEVFRAQCASCHQWAGEGGGLLGRNAPSLAGATPTQLGEAVRAGPVTMPAFGPATISPHDLDSLAAYVRYLRAPEDRGGLGLWHLGPFAEGLIAWAVGMVVLIAGLHWIGEREPK
jgi:ubiquinol-cytochrome c reductase cytochrome c subunit